MSISQFVSHLTQPKLSNNTGICAVCGANDNSHYLVNDILDSSTGKINELFKFDSNLICSCCVSLWKKPKVWHRSIFVTSDRLAFPLIAPEGSIKKAEQKMARDILQDWNDRPTWSNLIRDRSWWKQERYAVLTTDGQRRIWYKARASRGENLAIVFHDMTRGVSEIVNLCLPKSVEILDLVEMIYSNGYSKSAIENSLFLNLQVNAQTMGYEKELSLIRNCDEFRFAVVIAQKNANS